MTPLHDVIPFEQQADTPGNRLCGAASLCMVYRSLGIACSQGDIWDAVSRRAYRGRRAQTQLMAADVLRRGLAALILQSPNPWPLLQHCAERGARVILNHRVKPESAEGHYSVLVSIDENGATLHDPLIGPSQAIERDALLRLWKPLHFRSEIVGNVLLAIHASAAAAPPCRVCGKSLPDAHRCLLCNKDVPLRPAAVLACATPDCPERRWGYLYCPNCDTRTERV